MTKPTGNRPGRPKGARNKAGADLRDAARKYTDDALKTLASVMRTSDSDASRVAAATALLDRGHGKPPQAHTGEGGEGAIKHEAILWWMTPEMAKARGWA